MKAKLLILAGLSGLLLVSCCGRNSRKNSAAAEPTTKSNVEINISDSLYVVTDGGDVVTNEFVGLLPGADVPGINYDLSLIHYETTDYGVYELILTYIDGEGPGKDMAFSEYGRYSTLTGTSDDESAKYIRLVPFDSDQQTNFVYEKSGALTLLNQDLGHIKSEHNYTLVKKSKIQ